MKAALLPIFAGLLWAGVIAPPPALAAESDWQVVKIADRDYLSLDNIAHFYRLTGNPRIVDRRVVLGDGRTEVEFSGNPREIYINGIKQWLSFPAVVQDDQVLISRFDLAKTLEPALRPTMIDGLRSFRTVVLDAGHGGVDKGAASRTGFEKDYTLDLIRDLKKELEARGLKVVLTRGDDSYLTLEDRADLANDVGDEVFVSIHFNSSNDGGRASGCEVYAMTPRGAASTGDSAVALEQFQSMPGNDFDNASLALATCVQYSILGHIPEIDRGVRRARFAVLRLTHAPAILIEGGFLTNPADGRSINDPAWREKLAESVAQGIASYHEVAAQRQPPKLLVDYRSEQLPVLGTIVNPATLAANPGPTPGELVPVGNVGLDRMANASIKGVGRAAPIH